MPLRQIRNLLRFGRVRTLALAKRKRKPRTLVRNPHWELTNMLGYLATSQARASGDFFFVQIGAFDGNDDLSRLVRANGWRGVLIEPQADAFQTLKRNYSDQPQLQFFQVAIGPKDGELTLYTRNDGGVVVASSQQHLLIKPGHGKDKVVAQTVPCWTLETLLSRAGVQRPIDLLQIDAEGMDFEIIRSIDFSRCKPALLRFEHALLSERDRDACFEFLAARGYRFVLEDLDATAVLTAESRESQRAA